VKSGFDSADRAVNRWVLPVFGALALVSALSRQAHACMDQGTDGVVFGWPPLMGTVAVVFFATVHCSWRFAASAASFIRRRRWWALALLVAAAGAVVPVLIIRNVGRTEGETAVAPARLSTSRQESEAPGKDDRRRELNLHQALNLLLAQQDNGVGPAESFRLFSPGECPDIARCRYELDHESRSAFVFDKTAVIERAVVPADGQKLAFAVAAHFPQGCHKNDSVAFGLCAEVGDGRAERRLYACEWQKDDTRLQRWSDVAVDLSDYAGRSVTLRFEVHVRKYGRADRPGGLCLLSDPHFVASGTSSRPSVLLCTIETLRRDHLSLYGYPRKTSPFLEELAGESIVFEEAYSQSSWTRPSVASVLTGLAPSQHGAVTALDALDDSNVLLSEILRERGYVTAGFCTGRIISRPIFNYLQGFDVFVDERFVLFEQLRGDVLAWLEANGARPCFVFIHVFDPHGPYAAPGRFCEMFAEADYAGPMKDIPDLKPRVIDKLASVTAADVDYVRARYDGEIRYTDAVLERLVEGLKKRGLWDDMLVLITSDHGEEFGEHGGWGHGMDLLPEKLRVPLLLKLPGGRHGGTRMGGPASGVDVMPTLLAALGMPVPENLAGVDLLENVGTTRKTTRRHHFAEFYETRFLADGAPRCEPTYSEYSVISGRFQYVLRQFEAAGSARKEWLFDLVADPAATNNLAASRPGLLRQYAEMIRARYEPGYTIAATGRDGVAHVFSGIVTSEAPIVHVERALMEQDDSVQLDSSTKTLSFELAVHDDRDLVRFRTEPPCAPLTIDVALDGTGALPETVLVGCTGVSSGELPLRVPSSRCAVDAAPGRVPDYETRDAPSLYFWRRGTPSKAPETQVAPASETLEALKDLGYL